MPSNHSTTTGPVLRFGHFEADPRSGQLRKRGMKVRLRHQSFDVLLTLLEHPGEVVLRDELRRQLWHDDVHVDFDKSLNTVVGRLRAVLGDSSDTPRFIETLPKRGYRFIADVYAVPAEPGGASTTRARLAVLPFANLSSGPGVGCLADAVTEEIITALASIAPERLAVIARTTAMHYKGSHKDVAHIGRELSVDYIVEGGVRPEGQSIAINVQLIQTSDQMHLFARKYVGTLEGISEIQSSIARKIATKIPVAGNRNRSAVRVRGYRKPPTGNLDALDEYIHGRTFLDKANPTAMTAAKHHFERAIALDPEFAHAYDALAELHWYMGYLGLMRPREAFAAGIVHAVRAIEIDGTRAETHALLGQFHKISEYNWSEVHREMDLARRLDPHSPLVRMRYALSDLMPFGRINEAIAELEWALEVDQYSIWARNWLGIVLILGRQYDRAIEESKKLLSLDPASPHAFFVMGGAYRYLQKLDEAIAAFRDAVELTGGAAMMLGWLGLTLADSGQHEEARAILQQLYDRSTHKYVPPSSIGWIHLGLREIDRAFECFDLAVDECDQLMMPIKTYAFLAPIRSDPRFALLLHKMNLT